MMAREMFRLRGINASKRIPDPKYLNRGEPMVQ